jgi:molybdenum cofactor cytidylyltransferase
MTAAARTLGAILLAAGSSSRLGQAKQLIELDGEPLVRRQARLLLALEPACVVVVTGCAAAEVTRALADLPVTCVHNADWKDGMGTSLACGVRAMPERARGALLLLADLWRIDADDLQAMVDRWAGQPQQAVTACWGDASGPPAIFPRQVFVRLARLRGESGARQILKHFKGGLTRLEVPHAAFDLDTPGDLTGFRSASAPG